MKESIPCENCGRYYGHTSNCLSFIIKSSSGNRMDVLEKLQAQNAKLREALKNCPILGEVHRDSNDRFKEWNLEYK